MYEGKQIAKTIISAGCWFAFYLFVGWLIISLPGIAVFSYILFFSK
jgi:hypothetical protein